MPRRFFIASRRSRAFVASGLVPDVAFRGYQSCVASEPCSHFNRRPPTLVLRTRVVPRVGPVLPRTWLSPTVAGKLRRYEGMRMLQVYVAAEPCSHFNRRPPTLVLRTRVVPRIRLASSPHVVIPNRRRQAATLRKQEALPRLRCFRSVGPRARRCFSVPELFRVSAWLRPLCGCPQPSQTSCDATQAGYIPVLRCFRSVGPGARRCFSVPELFRVSARSCPARGLPPTVADKLRRYASRIHPCATVPS